MKEGFKASSAEAEEAIEEVMLSSQPIFQGRVIRVRKDIIRLVNGKQAEREVAEHPGGIVVCPFLPDGRIVLVRQWRYPLKQALLELPAGKLERKPDGSTEEPFPAIQRELEEETGYQAKTWAFLTHIFPAPGFCDEKLYLYKATDLFKPDVAAHTPDEDENIELVMLTPEEAWARVLSGGITDAKTVCLLALCR